MFHDELLSFLHKDLQKRKSENGWDDVLDPEIRSYADMLSRSLRSTAPMPLEEIISQYQHLFNSSPSHLEQKLMVAFPDAEMKDLRLPSLRIYRGLPRLYRKNQPTVSKIDPKHSHFPALLRKVAKNKLLSLDSHFSVPSDANIVLVAGKGQEDLVIAERIRELIRKTFPIDVRLVASHEVESGDAVLQIADGSIVSSSDTYSMGLHFLDLGLFLDGRQTKPGERKSRLFLADLESLLGISVYLHAVMKSLLHDQQDINFCFRECPILRELDLRLLKAVAQRYSVQRIIFEVNGAAIETNVQDHGKTVRIRGISASDFQRMIPQGENFIACHSPEMLSRIIAHTKGFFYDGEWLAWDLAALSTNRLSAFPSLQGMMHGFCELSLHRSEEDWVDEREIRSMHRMEPFEIAEKMGEYLQDSKTFAGFHQLNQIIAKEFDCQNQLLELVRQTIFYQRHPERADRDEQELKLFSYGQTSFSSLVQCWGVPTSY